jgi:sugar lactone lactonase YvrE
MAVGVDNSLYVSDYSNNRVIKLQAGSLVGVIAAGTGTSGTSYNQLHGPTGLYVDTSLNIYVVDSQNYRVMLWYRNSSTGIKVAGTGTSGNTLNSFGTGASGLFVDSKGNIFLSDSSNQRIMKWAANATNAIIVAGTGVTGSGSEQLNVPYGLDVDELNSYLYVADYNNHRIQRYHLDVSTNGTTVAGGYGAGAGSNQLHFPYSTRVSKMTGAIYITDSGNDRIQRWNSGATSGVTIAGNGALSSNYSTSLSGAMDLTLDINETYLFVSEMSYNRIWRFQLI